ncbi:MAG: hypothetical protein KatS3mg114_1091 [Planctomycetaceae bacterium]|nr:MAG: hypothetical protein KatS3mg114_1091 [Planctomycetaceae bacterium]
MPTSASPLCCCLLAWGLCLGCAHFFEQRAIERFAENLRQQDYEGLKDCTSPQFAARALRTADALRDLQILNLPDGKLSVVEVEELDPQHKRVIVEVTDPQTRDPKKAPKKEVFYELVKDQQGRWVVDDIYLKQKKQGVTAYKSLTEQMDLLLTVRRFLEEWSGGDREAVLQGVTAEMRAALELLPPQVLAELIDRVVPVYRSQGEYRPFAQMEEQLAVVRLPRKTGQTVLTLARQGERWLIQDVAVDSPDESQVIPSMHKLAIAINTALGFLEAFAQERHAELQGLCDPDLYEGSLSLGPLHHVTLPSMLLPDHKLEAQLVSQRAHVLLRNPQEVVEIDLARLDPEEPSGLPQFKVREVTIYDLETKEEKRLSALLTAHDMLRLFAEALSERDLDLLRQCATRNFTDRVWHELNAVTIQGLPLQSFDDPDVTILNTRYQGTLTRCEVRQGTETFTYLLREENGRFVIDDIHWQKAGCPTSLKDTLEALIPIRNFAAAVALARNPAEQASALDLLRKVSSADFNRAVWSQLEFVPDSGLSADSFLETPVRSITRSEQQTLVLLGSDSYGAAIMLKQERERPVIDEIRLITGPREGDQVLVKRTLRTLLAEGKARPPGQPRPEIRLARPKDATSPVIPAVYQEAADKSVPREFWPDEPIEIGPLPPTTAQLPPEATPSYSPPRRP